MKDTLQDIVNDPWPFVVGLAIVGSIYFVMFTIVPWLFKKAIASKSVQHIAQSKIVTDAAHVVNVKPAFSFEFRELPGREAMAAFESAKAECKGIPVIIAGGEDYRQSLADSAQYQKTTKQSLRLADRFPDPYQYRAKPPMPKKWEELSPFPTETDPFLVKDHQGNYRPVVTLAYIPAGSSAEIPAYLRLGGWNAVPEADIMVALFRKWQRDYGAEIVAVRMDAMDVHITRSPATREEALMLAREHLKFCDTGATLAEAAAELMATKRWHFYWD